MTLRERILAVLNYQSCDRLPLLHFGFWDKLLSRWAEEGHIDVELAQNWADGRVNDIRVGRELGFEGNWQAMFQPSTNLFPTFEKKVLEMLPDGGRKFMNDYGVVVLQKDDAYAIPMEFDHTLKGRKEWREHYLPRLQFSPQRIEDAMVPTPDGPVRYSEGGQDYLRSPDRELPCGLHCGSLYGVIRNWIGLVNVSYMMVDDEELLDEIIETVGSLCLRCTEYALAGGGRFDYGHFWEDICFKTGPLIAPEMFRRKIGPHYRRITRLLNDHGIHVVSVDCDGCIDDLVPIWLENGVKTMFPIEVGTWKASIAPWRKKYGKRILGVGGMNKHLFARDTQAVEQEIQRLKPLVELGGYIPCPDHRIAEDALWGNVQYYCRRMKEEYWR